MVNGAISFKLVVRAIFCIFYLTSLRSSSVGNKITRETLALRWFKTI